MDHIPRAANYNCTVAEAAIIIIDFVCARLRSLLGKNGGARTDRPRVQFANIGAELF
jgi:hypothetical protein